MFLWRNFHHIKVIGNEPDFEDDENEDGLKELMEIELTCVKRENDDMEEDLHKDDIKADKTKGSRRPHFEDGIQNIRIQARSRYMFPRIRENNSVRVLEAS